eukprot:scaffold71061_cov27-Tisochrysis_lutea.AAC.1
MRHNTHTRQQASRPRIALVHAEARRPHRRLGQLVQAVQEPLQNPQALAAAASQASTCVCAAAAAEPRISLGRDSGKWPQGAAGAASARTECRAATAW